MKNEKSLQEIIDDFLSSKEETHPTMQEVEEIINCGIGLICSGIMAKKGEKKADELFERIVKLIG